MLKYVQFAVRGDKCLRYWMILERVCNIWAHQPDPVTIEVFLLVGCPMCCPAIARCRSPCSPPLPDVQHTQFITIHHSQDSCSWILESPSWTTPTGSGPSGSSLAEEPWNQFPGRHKLKKAEIYGNPSTLRNWKGPHADAFQINELRGRWRWWPQGFWYPG